ncbi:MAG: M15 family metallopeptidase [Pseudomonadota bacterium]
MKSKGVWKDSCPMKIEDLMLLKIPYYDFNGNVKTGNLVILKPLSKRIASIFNELFQIKFPIHSIDTIDRYHGDDERSMEANNTYGFCCRKDLGSDELSSHSFGIAIDINPLQNPYISHDGKVYPKLGIEFLDRANIRPGMVDNIVNIFQKYGFEWGGNWKNPDYQHFQLEKNIGIKITTVGEFRFPLNIEGFPFRYSNKPSSPTRKVHQSEGGS